MRIRLPAACGVLAAGMSTPESIGEPIASMGDRLMTHIEILFKEYDTLREEALTTITVRSAILAFGLATTVGAFAALTLLPVNSEAPERSGLPDFVLWLP